MTLYARLRVSRLLAVCVLFVVSFFSSVSLALVQIAPAATVAIGDAAYYYSCS